MYSKCLSFPKRGILVGFLILTPDNTISFVSQVSFHSSCFHLFVLDALAGLFWYAPPPIDDFAFFIVSSQVSSHFFYWSHFPDHVIMSPRMSFHLSPRFVFMFLSSVTQQVSPRHTQHSLVNRFATSPWTLCFDPFATTPIDSV